MIGDDTGISAAKARSTPRRDYVNGFRLLAVTSAVLLVFIGAVAYKASYDRINALSDRIDSTRAFQREKIDEMLSPLVVDSVSVRSATDDEFIQGAITYAKDESDNFSVSFEVPVFVDVRGKGTGTILGAKVLFDDKLMKIFATYPNGVANHRIYDLYKNGVFFSLEKPIQITQGLSYLYTPSYAFHRSTCADVRQLVSDVSGKVYEVDVQPFMSNVKEASEAKKFRVTFTQDSLYQCE